MWTAIGGEPRFLSTRRFCRSATMNTGPAASAPTSRLRDAGVNLAFFSGNEVFWKTRRESSIDGSGGSLSDLGLLQGDPCECQDRPDAGCLDGDLARRTVQSTG